MTFKPSTDDQGNDFKEEIKLAVWNKIPSPLMSGIEDYKLDKCGLPMIYSHYGNTELIDGWEIDHIKPRANGGKSTLDNLQPLNWRTNRSKANNYPWDCSEFKDK